MKDDNILSNQCFKCGHPATVVQLIEAVHADGKVQSLTMPLCDDHYEDFQRFADAEELLDNVH